MAQTTGFTVWLTGMSGTGKTTVANYIAARLRQVGRNVEVLDEGEVAEELWSGLGDTKEERITIMRRLAHVAGMLARNDVAVLVPCVSPYKSVREEIRRSLGRYVEVFVDCPTEKLIERDTTGRYKKALSGELPNFIGITEPYEPPTSAEVILQSDTESVEEGGTKIFQSLLDLGYVNQEELKVITGKKMKANPNPKRERVVRREVRTARPAKGGKGAKAAAKSSKPAKAAKPSKAGKARPAKAARPTRSSRPSKKAMARPATRAARVAKSSKKKAASRRKR